jgi:hypothetical protein
MTSHTRCRLAGVSRRTVNELNTSSGLPILRVRPRGFEVKRPGAAEAPVISATARCRAIDPSYPAAPDVKLGAGQAPVGETEFG